MRDRETGDDFRRGSREVKPMRICGDEGIEGREDMLGEEGGDGAGE